MFVTLLASTSRQARLVRISCLSPTPPHPKPPPKKCRPLCPFLCTFVLPCIRAKFSLELVPTCKSSPWFYSSQPAFPSSPHNSTSLPAVAFDMKHWIFHQIPWIPLCPSSSLLNPSFVSQKQLVFLKHIYTKNWRVACCAEAFSLQISYKVIFWCFQRLFSYAYSQVM